MVILENGITSAWSNQRNFVEEEVAYWVFRYFMQKYKAGQRKYY